MSARAIGIAGYSGCGKSAAAAHLQKRLNAPLINADAEAKRFMAQSPAIIDQLIRTFGSDIHADAVIDFSLLGTRAFASAGMLDKLNNIVHPPFVAHLRKLIDGIAADSVIVDAALIILWRIEFWFPRLIWIDAPREIRIQRLLKTGTLNDCAVRQRTTLQERLFDKPAGPPWTVIRNAGDITDLYAAIDALSF